ncbi:hypothetical protein CEXT_425361 [Caerostris extrusa]|uniref:C2H2-type domain-containing protein n=1 Tax=Caerostris extrusa TaxID=172846 RepID=A0AAV4UYX5_CAEEX|nr:hypothetical protein CEXT_425361 [Caerostris extrusa]
MVGSKCQGGGDVPHAYLYKCHQCPKTRFDLESDLINHYKMHEEENEDPSQLYFRAANLYPPKTPGQVSSEGIMKKRCTKCDATFVDRNAFTRTYGNVVLLFPVKRSKA